MNGKLQVCKINRIEAENRAETPPGRSGALPRRGPARRHPAPSQEPADRGNFNLGRKFDNPNKIALYLYW